MSESKLNIILAQLRKEREVKSSNVLSTDRFGNTITLNEKQIEAVQRIARGESIVLCGAAGTGKTTSQKAALQELILSGKAGVLDAEDHSHLESGTPGIIICAFTRRAVTNIKKNLPTDLQKNCVTVHKLLEFRPVYYPVTNEKTGEEKMTMRFEETRNSFHPLPRSIRAIVIEESSMLGIDLYKKLKNALPHTVQWIFLGDIQQLRPVFGPAILGFKLLQLPVIELTQVYRQALESPIIRLAHRILSGVPIPATEFSEWKVPGQLTLHPWKKKISDLNALNTAAMFFVGNKHLVSDLDKQVDGAFSKGLYDPLEDMILMPFNEAFGTIELNKKIAHFFAWKTQSEVYEVIAGFKKHYFRVGEKVLYDKEDAEILSIEKNPTYTGVSTKLPSITLDYWGHDSRQTQKPDEKVTDEDIDFMLAQVASTSSEDRVNQSSHRIKLKMIDSDSEIILSKAAEVNSLLLGYALTVHKAQGSEWRKVFVLFHQSHATMILREMLYTAITRAKEELYVICESDTFVKGIERQGIKGNTIEEKAEFFKGKIEAGFKFEE